MPRQRVMVPYPPDVIAEIDKIVSHGKRTAFLVELAKREIKLNRQRQALRAATGARKTEDGVDLLVRQHGIIDGINNRDHRNETLEGD